MIERRGPFQRLKEEKRLEESEIVPVERARRDEERVEKEEEDLV
jgi:hypothetical protein